MKNNYSINVLILTYNQENVLGRAIDSVLQQKEWGLNQIIISDDCSTDGNWDVVQNYVENYPETIKAYRNNPNLGIYGNMNALVERRGDADFYCILAGDDILCDDYFKEVDRNISFDTLPDGVTIFCNNKTVYPDGKELINKNRLVSDNLCGQYVRGRLFNRGCLLSKNVMKQFEKAPLDRGLLFAESFFDLQYYKYTKSAIYVDFCGAAYYAQLGISKSLSREKSDYRTKQTIDVCDYQIKEEFKSDKDIRFLKSVRAKAEMSLNPSVYLIFDGLYNLILSRDSSMGLSFKEICIYIGSMIKRYFHRYR